MQSERDSIKKLLTITHEEILFLDRGYDDKPVAVQKEYDLCQGAFSWLTDKMNELNAKECKVDAIS